MHVLRTMACVRVCCHAKPKLQAWDDSSPGEVAGQPVYIALVDLTCGADFLELVKSGLLAALEALPPAALFALITFSTKVTLQLVVACITGHVKQSHQPG